MLLVDTKDPREQRKFGIVMAAAFGVLGGIRYALHGFESLPTLLWGIALVFLVLGLLLPALLGPVFALWLKLALAINWVMTRAFLALAFYGIITPTRCFIHFFGDDPLKRAWHKNGDSYWEAPEEQPKEIERYRQQF